MQYENIKNNQKKDIRIINILKGILIFLVLYGHSIQYGSGNEFLNNGGYWFDPIMKLIYSFHMPLFMSVSGYLMYYSVERHGLLNSVLTRITRFLPIFATWSVILCLLDYFIKGKSFLFKRFIYYFFTDFWFLWAIVFCAIVLFFVEVINNKLNINRKFDIFYYLIVSLILLVLFFISPDFYVFASYKYMFPYYLVGYLYAKHNFSFLHRKAFGFSMLLLWILLLFKFNYETYIYTTGITLLQKENKFYQLFINIYRYSIGFFGSFSCCFIVYNIDNLLQKFSSGKIVAVIRSIFEYLGKQSLSIYILSTYLYDRYLPIITTGFTPNYFIIFIETIVILCLCLLIAKIISCSKILTRIIIGANIAKRR